MTESSPGQLPRSEVPRSRRVSKPPAEGRDRPRASLLWYRAIQWIFSTTLAATCGLRVSGRENIPASGSAMLVCNHLSHLDVLVLGILLKRPLNFVARSSLFFFPLGLFIRSLGAFPFQRDGIGAQGLKETLRRLKSGGIVTLFPEGTRSSDGDLAELKSGIALLARKARVPILPAAIAGTFEAWPNSSPHPVPHPVWVHFGHPIDPEQFEALGGDGLTALIRERILGCQSIARDGIARGASMDA